MMYEKLVKSLRNCVADENGCCFRCQEDCNGPCQENLMTEAADAIENLQKQLQKSEVDNINLTGWLAEEHAKAEDFENRLNLWRQDKIRRWISVTERLPDENGKYLTVFTVNTIPPRPVIEVSCYAKDLYKIDKYDFQDKKKKSGFYQYDSEWGYFEMTDISHWMPMPIPPLPEDGKA